MAEKEKGKGGGGKKETIARYYSVVDGKLQRKNQWCPKCGPGVFLAVHGTRTSCGKCGYTEFRENSAPKK